MFMPGIVVKVVDEERAQFAQVPVAEDGMLGTVVGGVLVPGLSSYMRIDPLVIPHEKETGPNGAWHVPADAVVEVSGVTDPIFAQPRYEGELRPGDMAVVADAETLQDHAVSMAEDGDPVTIVGRLPVPGDPLVQFQFDNKPNGNFAWMACENWLRGVDPN